MSALHVDNLVDALILAADHGNSFETYFVADAGEGTLKSVIGGLLATHGVDCGEKSIAFGAAGTMAGIMGAVWRIFRLKGEPPITRQMLRLIGQPFAVRMDKAKRELGYVPRASWKIGDRRDVGAPDRTVIRDSAEDQDRRKEHDVGQLSVAPTGRLISASRPPPDKFGILKARRYIPTVALLKSTSTR